MNHHFLIDDSDSDNEGAVAAGVTDEGVAEDEDIDKEASVRWPHEAIDPEPLLLHLRTVLKGHILPLFYLQYLKLTEIKSKFRFPYD